jgi:predicted NBD/HSP70 family sugar kinase
MPRTSPARPALLRSLNDRTVLTVLLAQGPSSRADVVRATGLSKPTVAEALTRLEDAGLILGAGETVGRRGPNGRLYDLALSHLRGAALTVEPGRLRCDILDARGVVLRSIERTRADLPRGAAEATHALVAEAARAARLPESSVCDLVISVPGSYDAAHDQVRYADRIPDWTVPGIAAAIGGAFRDDVTVTLDNDVNLALVAERGDEPRTGVTSLLWLGAGVGLATDMAGVLYRGVSGGAGEVGYIPVPGTDARGGHPDFQDLVGGAAVLRLAREHRVSGRTAVSAVERAVETMVTEAASTAFLDELAARIALGLSVIVAVLDPGVVVLGGTVGRAGGPALASRTSKALRTSSRLRCAVVGSAVAGDPALVGARAVTVEQLTERLLDAGNRSTSSTRSDLVDAPNPIPLPRTAKEVHAR